MLFALGHGQHIIENSGATAPEAAAIDAAPIEAVAPGVASALKRTARQPALAGAEAVAADMVSSAADDAEHGKFRYYFPNASGLPSQTGMPGLLDALAETIVADDVAALNAAIPPIFTYIGQFIDHDITANTDRDDPQQLLSLIDGDIEPLPRSEVTSKLKNLRNGSLGLDSLYGDALDQDAFSLKLAGLMRFPGNPAKMRLAFPAPVGDAVPFPADRACDLLRLGFLIRHGLLTVAELQALPPDLRSVFINKDTNEPIVSRAIIGDSRNDENLIISQLQVLFLRFHNKLVDATGGSFHRARRLTRFHYQWLVANVFLPTICSPGIVAEVMSSKAKLYADFFAKHGAVGDPRMPMPLEFSVAGFRYGHSMVRGAYDFNRRFGEEVVGSGEHKAPVAPLDLLFAFTGDGGMPELPGDPPNTTGQLPQRWVIEWDRFIGTDSTHSTRAARKIDSHLAAPLGNLVNPPAGVFKHLAKRNLRRAYRLDLPTAQSCIAAIHDAGFETIQALTPAQLTDGSAARSAAVTAGGFDTQTPLWFYIIKEAEVLGGGEHLGPLGSHIVANTLLGLIIHDPDSYWNVGNGPWSPGRFNPTHPIDSIEDVVRFCGMI